jgi:hypothetical protein
MISVKFRNQIESQPAEFTQLISDQPLSVLAWQHAVVEDI